MVSTSFNTTTRTSVFPAVNASDVTFNISGNVLSVESSNISGYAYDYYDQVFYDTPNKTALEYGPCFFDMDAAFKSTPSYVLCIHILLPIFCTFGIVGIILTIHVLSRKTMSTSTNSYLISLASSDLVFLLIMSMYCLQSKLTREGHYYFMVIMTYFNMIMSVFLLSSVWLTVMLAIERYIAICHPLRAMGICSVARARIIIVAIFILSVLLRIPDYLKYELGSFKDPCLDDQEVPYTIVTEIASNVVFRDVTAWIDCVLFVILPFGLLLFLNACLILEIHRSTNYLRYHLASDSNVQTIITGEEIKITLMLISVVVVFFVCEAPYVVLVVARRLNPDKVHTHFYLLQYITILLLVLRSSFNFILYCWFSEKFWSTFKKACCNIKCFFIRAPMWVRNQSDQVHSNSNRKISYFNTKETTF